MQDVVVIRVEPFLEAGLVWVEFDTILLLLLRVIENGMMI